MKKKNQRFNELIDSFRIVGEVSRIESFGGGHINDTYRIINGDAGCPDYILQKINHEVFKNVSGMMDNIFKVTNHLRSKYDQTESSLVTLELVATQEGSLFKKDKNGNYWRIFDFKKNTKTYDIVETPEQAYSGGKAFGSFLYFMSDFDANHLVETIPRFHDVFFRMTQLERAKANASQTRLHRTADILKDVDEMSDLMCEIESLKKESKIPLRVTHNDTKFNNVLLDKEDKGVCVIDLDTVMPGIVHYDFGDGIRTSTNRAKEDEQDLSKVCFDLEKFKAFSEGYFEGVNGILDPVEIEYLARSGALLPFIMGVRFLTDYLNGDVYYKISYEEQNYYRAACQVELAKQMLRREKELKDIIKQISMTA